MMLSRSCRQNPVLEVKRDGYLAEEREVRDNFLEVFKSSITRTQNLHANILFTTQSGRLILQDICRLVTYVDPSVINTNWRDLAAKLGYSDVEVKCISNLRGNIYDPTELVLQYYAATKTEGTIGHILQALLELGFLPALHEAQQHIDTLLTELENEKADLIESPTTEKGNYSCNNTNNVVKAADFKPFVPAIFNPVNVKETTVKVPRFHPRREEEKIQTSRPQKAKSNKQYCKYVMLSFADDGYSTALRVASVLRSTTNKKGLPIGVLMLCENDNQILENPGQIIPELMAKMDFVLPVLTEGYFKALKQPDLRARLLDERYIQFIHDILVSKYIRDRCLNIHVRAIIPRHAVDAVYLKPEFIHNSIFNAWKSEDEVPALADSILKSHKNQISQ